MGNDSHGEHSKHIDISVTESVLNVGQRSVQQKDTIYQKVGILIFVLSILYQHYLNIVKNCLINSKT